VLSEKEIRDRVHRFYWEKDLNCATTSLKILAEHFYTPLADQVIDSALAMHGAACYGAQCGLVEGPLLFMGIYGRSRGMEDDALRGLCYRFAEEFEHRFGSLVCRELRPGGFNDDDPEHLCESLTVQAVLFAVNFLNRIPR